MLALLALMLASGAATATADTPTDLLPDLVQIKPGFVKVRTFGTRARPRFALAFTSAVDNDGAGPLIVDGHRASARTPTMTADQVIRRSDGTFRVSPGVGRLRYNVNRDHQHWHYLGFDRYELRRASDYGLVGPDHKTGFCLGDRYKTGGTVPNQPHRAVFRGECDRNQPRALRVQEGISPGYGDEYGGYLEGQYIDVTHAPAGRYVLVHRVNADHRLLESDYTNDASSDLIELGHPHGAGRPPSVRVLARCQGADHCPQP